MTRVRAPYLYREPFAQDRLAVGDSHSLYVEESGNPDGIPVVVLHGGPGSGSRPKQRGYFDPARYRIILFDQRGCGRSRPLGALTANTTDHLVADLERLRDHLGVHQWLVFGGSWGSTLALAYASAHRERVMGMVLWGIFLGSREELAWTFGTGGAARLFPLEYERFLEPLSRIERRDPIANHYRAMCGNDGERRRRSLSAWTRWENKLSDLAVSEHTLDDQLADENYVLTHSLFEAHYFANGCFLERPLLESVGALRGLSIDIVQGQLDVVCPPVTAVRLQRALPESRLQLIPGAGHSPDGPTVDALIRSTDRLVARYAGAA